MMRMYAAATRLFYLHLVHRAKNKILHHTFMLKRKYMRSYRQTKKKEQKKKLTCLKYQTKSLRMIVFYISFSFRKHMTHVCMCISNKIDGILWILNNITKIISSELFILLNRIIFESINISFWSFRRCLGNERKEKHNWKQFKTNNSVSYRK